MNTNLQNRLNPPTPGGAMELSPGASVSPSTQAVDSTGPREEVDFRNVLFNSMQDANREREARARGDLSAESNEEFLERLAAQNRPEDERTPKNHLDKDDFMKLFVTQLKHQDPLNPDDGAEMASKLAHFNSLEQLVNVNDTLQSMVEMQSNSRSMMLSNFIGREISIEGGRLRLDDKGVNAASYNLPGGATQARFEVRDTSGTVVYERPLGSIPAGTHNLDWDGTATDGSSLPRGMYTYNVAAYDVDHREIPVDISTTVRITGVDINNLQGAMYTDFGRVELDEVRAVGEAGFSAATAFSAPTHTHPPPVEQSAISSEQQTTPTLEQPLDSSASPQGKATVNLTSNQNSTQDNLRQPLSEVGTAEQVASEPGTTTNQGS